MLNPWLWLDCSLVGLSAQPFPVGSKSKQEDKVNCFCEHLVKPSIPCPLSPEIKEPEPTVWERRAGKRLDCLLNLSPSTQSGNQPI
uniref:Uncharacterized protein n=1 Tax=Picea sitchensis TaxID=3332 RepID=A0A6B9XX31_PICSI|nr:hypothetical protein Q903MT_gene6728 [Picea sitchensis]